MCGHAGASKFQAASRIGVSQFRADCSYVATVGVSVAAKPCKLETHPTLNIEQKVTHLFDEIHEPVRRYLLRLSISSSEAEDIIQEVFLRLYKTLVSGWEPDNWRSWVFGVAHNLAINHLKRRGRVELAGDRPVELAALRIADSTPSPEEALLQKERLTRVQVAISTLSEQQKQCLYLRAEGLRYREIADILGVTVSTVAEYIRRGITKLARESDR